MKKLILNFSDFSICVECTETFNNRVESSGEAENPSQRGPYSSIRFLVTNGYHPDTLRKCTEFLKEVQYPTIRRCCLLKKAMDNEYRSITNEGVVQLLNPLDSGSGPSLLQVDASHSLVLESPSLEINGMQASTSQADMGGSSLFVRPTEKEQICQDLQAQKQDSKIAKTHSTYEKIAKPRKSNRSRKSSKRKNLKNSF